MTATAPVPVIPQAGTTSTQTTSGTTGSVNGDRPGSQGTAVLLVLGSCVSLQTGAALAMQLFPVLGSWGTTSIRLLVAAVVLMAIVRPKVRAWTGRQWRAAIAFGIAMALMNGFFYAALARIPLGPAVSIEFLGPLVLAAVLSLRPRDLIWVGLALAGVALFGLESALGSGGLDPVGVVLVLIAGGFWALYILTSSHVGQLIPGPGGLAVALLIAALLLLPFGAARLPQIVSDPHLLFLALGTGILASLLPYVLELSALRTLPRPVFGILLSLEPAVATLAGWILLGQEASGWKLMAVALVMTASIGSTLAARQQRPTTPEPAPSSAA
ncbi:EamA family transporter [Kocuria sp. JC486]|uniref:EamA family transporter n=1 Tax=Kocuria sp. JC486 TaxID=1970736 RepID=UPI001421745C|nr:EamA family transporter [Kocuria sp. JC486]NHU84185.1 EamA family transporter [Kocuria sp. JC486]